MTSKIETELQKATGVKLKKGEARQGYLHRLAKEAFDKLPDATFNKLSKAAQGWVNDASEEWDEAVERGLKETDAKLVDFPDGTDAEPETAAKETKEDGASTNEAEEPAIRLDNEGGDKDVASKKKGKAAPKKAATKAPAKEAKAAPAKKAAAKADGRAKKGNGATRSRVDQAAKIKLLVKENPKRGEKSKKWFAMYRDGMTVKEYVAKGGSTAWISWDVRHNFIKLV